MGLIKFRKWDNRGSIFTNGFVRIELDKLGIRPEYVSLRDQDYRGLSDEDFEVIKEKYCTFGVIKYRKKVYECEDFVYRMWSTIVDAWADLTTTEEALALACGCMVGINGDNKSHAWFWRMNDKAEMRFYEAETGKIMAKAPIKIYSAEA